MRGNQPNSPRSTVSSPSAFVTTVTPSASSAAAWFRDPDGCDRGDITPLALMTRCQGTLLWLKRASGSSGRCLRHTPTWRGRWARGGRQ